MILGMEAPLNSRSGIESVCIEIMLNSRIMELASKKHVWNFGRDHFLCCYNIKLCII